MPSIFKAETYELLFVSQCGRLEKLLISAPHPLISLETAVLVQSR